MTRKGIEYDRRHRRLVRSVGKAAQHNCVDCGEIAIDWSQIHGTDGEKDFDYEPRCRSCHKRYDMTEEIKENISLGKSRFYKKCVWGHDFSVPGNRMKSGKCAECNRSLKRAKRRGMTLAQVMKEEGRARELR